MLPPPPPGSIAERWERVLADHYYWAADRFKWPPTVVDEQPALLLDDLHAVDTVIEQWRRDQAEREG